MEFCPKIIHLKKIKSNTFFKIMPKLVFKTLIGDYGFNFKLKTVVNNYCDAPKPGGPLTTRQPAENLCISYHETYT